MFKRFAGILILAVLSLTLINQAQAKGGGGGGTQPTPTPGTVTPLTISMEPLPEGYIGTNYVGFLTSSGGQGTPHRWSVIAGRVPDGLTMASSYGLNSTVISGNPRTVQTA